MPVTASDIKYFLSIKTGSAGNSQAQADPNASLGKYISTTEISGTALNNLFDNVSGDENAASDVEYRCLFVKNISAITFENVFVWIASQVSGGADVAIGLDTTAISAHGSASAQALEVANENTAPSGVTFSAPTTKATGLSIGNLAQNQVKALWLRRTATNSAALNNDGVTIEIGGETAA